jgi:hypothetical protein
VAETRQGRAYLLLCAVVLLLIAASRWMQAGAFDFNSDETWSMWIALGSPGEIAQWVEPQWTPLYTGLLSAWQTLTGIHPTIVRYSSVLTSMLGVAFAYRAAYRLGRPHRRRAALLAALAYAALGFAIYLGSQMRGYPLSLTLMPLLVWLALRYFERPSWARAGALAACMVLMFYVNLTSAFAFVAVGMLVLFVYGRRARRWWLPGVIAAVPALPLILETLGRPNTAALKARNNPPPPFFEAMYQLYRDYAGDFFVVWVVLFIVAGWLLWRRGRDAAMVGFLAWTVALPAAVYVFNEEIGFFSPRYQWWVMFGIALWVGWGLAHLPRWGQWAAAGFLVVTMFVVIPYERYSFQTLIPLRRNFELLARHYQAGDVILRDTNCIEDGGCRADYEWQYFVQAYFPDGPVFVEDPGEHRRVWYVKQDGWQDDALEAQIADGRVLSTFFGPWDFLFQLYEAPPDPEGVRFDNGMRFHGVQFPDAPQPYVWHEGETVRVRLWWSVDEPIADDYSVGVYMMYEERPVDQTDGPQTIDLFPASTAPPPQEVSLWEPGRYYVEERELAVPDPKQTDTYPLYMAVYQWWDGERIAAPGTDDDGLYFLANVNVKAW